jgi:hypothetical protein
MEIAPGHMEGVLEWGCVGRHGSQMSDRRIGKAALNVPVTQMVKTGAMRRSVHAVIFPLVSQLKKDMPPLNSTERQERRVGGLKLARLICNTVSITSRSMRSKNACLTVRLRLYSAF